MPQLISHQRGDARPTISGLLASLVMALVWTTACSPKPKLEVFPTNAYLESPGDFLGNSYSLKAQIHSQIKWEKGVGRILAVKPEGQSTRLPVFVPEVQGNNLHVGQRFELHVLIEEGGLIYVEDLHKY